MAPTAEPNAETHEERRGSDAESTEPRFLVIGRVTRPHGVHGEVRAEIHTDVPERFTWLKELYLGERDPMPVAVESVRFHKKFVLLKLAGYDSRDAADGLRRTWLQVPVDESIPLEPGEYFLYQLIGLEVYTDEDEHLGQVAEVIETAANNVFLVRGTRGEVLLPDIDDVILKVDVANGRITVHLIPGLIPD